MLSLGLGKHLRSRPASVPTQLPGLYACLVPVRAPPRRTKNGRGKGPKPDRGLWDDEGASARGGSTFQAPRAMRWGRGRMAKMDK